MAPNVAGGSIVPYNPAALSNLGNPSENSSGCASEGRLVCLGFRASTEPSDPPAPGHTRR